MFNPKVIFDRAGLWSIVCSVLFLFAPGSHVSAAQVSSGLTTITEVQPYTDVHSGDVIVRVQATLPPECAEGFWMKQADIGFNSTYAMLLAAFYAGRQVTLFGMDDELWPAGTLVLCRLRLMR